MKGFIEVTRIATTSKAQLKTLVNIDNIANVTDSVGITYIMTIDSSVMQVTETYEEIKSMIEKAVGE